jgi:hypothetical protein
MSDFEAIGEEIGTCAFAERALDAVANMGEKSIKGELPFLYRKERKTCYERGRNVFRELWVKDFDSSVQSKGIFFGCLGTPNKSHKNSTSFTTIYSPEGELKQTFDLPVDEWAPYPFLEQLYGKRSFLISGGRLIAKDEVKIQKNTEQYRSLKASRTHGPMHYVFDHLYSRFELNRIENANPSDLAQWISELENFGTDAVRTITETENLPLFAKGLTGFSKTIGRRKHMRVEFWLSWAKNRGGLKEHAKAFNNPSTRNWDWKYA